MRSAVSDRLAGFSDRAVTRGDELYLGTTEALELVHAATRVGVRVVGIEFFDRIRTNFVPRLELIADFSDAPIAVSNIAA